MKWIDGHIDLAYVALQGRNILKKCSKGSNQCISIPDLEQSPIQTFCGTIYSSPRDGVCGYGSIDNLEKASSVGIKQLEIYNKLEQQGHISIQRTGCTLDDYLSVLLLMEGADPITKPSDVTWWKSQGLRAVGLTWSAGTRYAGGNSSGGPITYSGIELISALDQEKIVHDASHLSDAAFDGLINNATGKIIASHSNSRAVLNSKSERHLNDDQANEIFKRGGVIGLNLCTQFLSPTFDKDNYTASIDDCVSHIMHYCEIAGNKTQVALGSDFDGGFSTKYLPDNLKHPNQMCNLTDALKKAGFTNEELDSFAHGAWMKIFS
ncbi:MAG: membrane dipeptidase [Phycisphaerales bacterium]|jgi:membrane dipeptidase|nr:membrane dipeptidase [Phycisphaerales bacterium]